MKKVGKAVFGFGRRPEQLLDTGYAGLACTENRF